MVGVHHGRWWWCGGGGGLRGAGSGTLNTSVTMRQKAFED